MTSMMDLRIFLQLEGRMEMNAIRMTHRELSRSRLRRLSLAITLVMAASGGFAQTGNCGGRGA